VLTFLLQEAKASGSALRPLPREATETAEPSTSKTKGLEIKMQPTVVPFAWKIVTNSVLEADCTRTCGVSDGLERAPSKPEGPEGAGFSSLEGTAEAGFSGRPPIVCVCGGKNVGKSTYGRYLVNRLLNWYVHLVLSSELWCCCIAPGFLFSEGG
jgi:polynucleotide 5'-kinase involved in rRNA processing